MALVSACRERFDCGREVHVAAADAEVDVTEDGITQVHVPDPAVKTADRLDLVASARNYVAEVQHRTDRRLPECLVQHFGPLDGGAQPPRVWRLYEQVQTRGIEKISGRGEGASHRGNVAGELSARLSALPAARKHDRGRADGLGQLNKGPQQLLQLGFVQARVIHVGDVRVDQPDSYGAVENLFRKPVDTVSGQRDGDVIAYPG